MRTSPTRHAAWIRGMALAAMVSLGTVSLAGCRGGGSANSAGQSGPPGGPGAPRQGLSTRQKAVILAGAAALYYLYNKHRNQKAQGKTGQYYLSKNGRVYYRDQNGKPVWVTPPREGIQVPASEAQQYSNYRGYNGQDTGETFGGYGADSSQMLGGPGGPGGPPGPGGR
jgi:hypothetical protein